ncbi:MAG TPA: hypothetical protein VMB47_18725 [Candidatus Aquilonibacter sp.]|nr:hypothetical protein [Candidatus Aquilonibacter sp.]
MAPIADHGACTVCLETPLPEELLATGLCFTHYIAAVERTCAVIRRQVATHAVSPEYRHQLASYAVESAVVLSRAASNMRLSNGSKDAVLTTFLSLMGLLEDADRVGMYSLELKRVTPQVARGAAA